MHAWDEGKFLAIAQVSLASIHIGRNFLTLAQLEPCVQT
jgi:hypothetical protein